MFILIGHMSRIKYRNTILKKIYHTVPVVQMCKSKWNSNNHLSDLGDIKCSYSVKLQDWFLSYITFPIWYKWQSRRENIKFNQVFNSNCPLHPAHIWSFSSSKITAVTQWFLNCSLESPEALTRVWKESSGNFSNDKLKFYINFWTNMSLRETGIALFV